MGLVKKGANDMKQFIKMVKLLLIGDFAFSAATVENEYWFTDCLWINFTVKGIPLFNVISPLCENAARENIRNRY